MISVAKSSASDRSRFVVNELLAEHRDRLLGDGELA